MTNNRAIVHLRTSHKEFVEHRLAEEGVAVNKVDYLGISMPRFMYTVELCKRFKPFEETKVLDIGRSYMSHMLAEAYAKVVTLGLPLGEHGYAHEYSPADDQSQVADHIEFDLNCTQEKSVPICDCFGLIVFAEVIEHLHTAPELVLHALAELLEPDGIIICLTPNAAALPKRLRLLRGANPFDRIRFDPSNPGHYREYTKRELIEMGASAGLEAIFHEYASFTASLRYVIPTSKAKILDCLCRVYPPFMFGQVVVYRRPIGNQ